MNKKYVVKLTEAERQGLQTLVSQGRAAARNPFRSAGAGRYPNRPAEASAAGRFSCGRPRKQRRPRASLEAGPRFPRPGR